MSAAMYPPPSVTEPTTASELPLRSAMFGVLDVLNIPFRLVAPKQPRGAKPVSLWSWKSTALRDVKLEDVLADRLQSPLSLRDFEGFLVFREHSAENLAFINWLDSYSKLYASYLSNPSIPKLPPAPNPNTNPLAPRDASHLPPHLATALRQGLDAFIAPDGSLELNLSSITRAKTLVAAGNSGDPEDFAEAKATVYFSLHRSLTAYVRHASTNAAPSRLGTCFTVGIVLLCMGLAPALVAIFLQRSRALRVIGFPFLAMGFQTCIMTCRGMCPAIWVLGNVRQCDPWEMTSVRDSSSFVAFPSSPRPDDIGASEASDSFQSSISGTAYPWEKLAASDCKTLPPSPSPPYLTKFTSNSTVTVGERRFWSPVYEVLNPDVQKAMWNTVVQALGVGVGCMLVVGAVLLAVPNY